MELYLCHETDSSMAYRQQCSLINTTSCLRNTSKVGSSVWFFCKQCFYLPLNCFPCRVNKQRDYWIVLYFQVNKKILGLPWAKRLCMSSSYAESGCCPTTNLKKKSFTWAINFQLQFPNKQVFHRSWST